MIMNMRVESRIQLGREFIDDPEFAVHASFAYSLRDLWNMFSNHENTLMEDPMHRETKIILEDQTGEFRIELSDNDGEQKTEIIFNVHDKCIKKEVIKK